MRMASAKDVGVLLGLLVMLSGCSATPPPTAEASRSMKELTFLTRDGCVNTDTMRARLNDALQALGLPADYRFIDADTLTATDVRGGYGTPTVLYAGRDLFGLAEPPVPHPSPT